jgi:hypothetical protein
MRGLIPETLGRGSAVTYDTGHDQSETESTWDGKDDGTTHPSVTACMIISLIRFSDIQSGFSFAALSDISHADSNRTPTFRPSKARQTYEPRDWLIACQEASEGETSSERTLNDDATSEAPSQWSSLSVSTVRAGNWINPAPIVLRQAPKSPLRTS